MESYKADISNNKYMTYHQIEAAINQGKKITLSDIDPKHWPQKHIGPGGKEIPWDESPETAAGLLSYAINSVRAEEDAKLYAKQREEELRAMEEFEKRDRERRELDQQYGKKLPERQLQMFLSGERPRCGHCHVCQLGEFFGHTNSCPYNTRGHDTEPGLGLLKKEYSTGRLIRLDEQTRNRLVESAKPGETWEDLMNRLLDIAVGTPTEAKQSSQ
jgi:hypothetical protein